MGRPLGVVVAVAVDEEDEDVDDEDEEGARGETREGGTDKAAGDAYREPIEEETDAGEVIDGVK
jgi:hypothetical protein